MTISIVDASEYFRGLLLLIRKDRKITEAENTLMKRIGKTLGFEREFCDNAIREILENRYIQETPPVFSAKEMATRFVKDGLTLTLADKEVHAFEAEWLRFIAEKNGLAVEWFFQELENAKNRKDSDVHLEVDDLSVEYC